MPLFLRADLGFCFSSAYWARMWHLSHQTVPLWAQFPSVLVWSLIRGPLVQIRVPEDLKLLRVLERTFTAIKVREANLSACLIYKFKYWIEKLMIVVIVQFVSGKVPAGLKCWIECCMYEIVVWKLMICWSVE